MKRTLIIMFFYLLSTANNAYSADTKGEANFTIICSDGKKFTCKANELAKLSHYWNTMINSGFGEGKNKSVNMKKLSSALISLVIESAQGKLDPAKTFNAFKKNNKLANEIINYLEFSDDQTLLNNLLINSQHQKYIPEEFENALLDEIGKNNAKIIKTMCSSFKTCKIHQSELSYINSFELSSQIPTDLTFASQISSYGMLYILTSEELTVDNEASLMTLLVKWITGNDIHGDKNEIEDKRRKFFSPYAAHLNFDKMSLHYLLNLAPLIASRLNLKEDEKEFLQSRIIAGGSRQAFPKTNFEKMFLPDDVSIKRKYNPQASLFFKCHFPDTSSFQEDKNYYTCPVLWNGIEVWSFVQINNAEEKKFLAFFRCRNPELGHNYELKLTAKITIKIIENCKEEDTTCQNAPSSFLTAENARGCTLQKTDGSFVKAREGQLTFTVLIDFDKPSLGQ